MTEDGIDDFFGGGMLTSEEAELSGLVDKRLRELQGGEALAVEDPQDGKMETFRRRTRSESVKLALLEWSWGTPWMQDQGRL